VEDGRAGLLVHQTSRLCILLCVILELVNQEKQRTKGKSTVVSAVHLLSTVNIYELFVVPS
jgi:hypothetical protein